MIRVLIYAFVILFALGDIANAEAPIEPTFYSYRVVNKYPHDKTAFTQGLFFEDGDLYESTGQHGASTLRRVALETGETLKSVALSDDFFGEGSVGWSGKIVVLTWRSGGGFVFDRNTFEKTRDFTYDGEGWGLTHDGERLIMSDGTPELRFLDPETLEETGRLSVTFRGKPLRHINELEWVNGEIFANVWHSNAIVRIDPATGVVTGVIDLRGLLADEEIAAGVDVLNGVAYDAENDRLFVTGKNWPALFEIEIIKQASDGQ